MRTLFAGAAIFAAAIAAGNIHAQPSPDRKPVPTVASETVTIKSGSSSFAGNFETPMGNGQHGGVVIIAPSTGPAADAAKSLAKTLAKHGLVALTYEADLNAENARAALATLRQRGDVNKMNVGVVGVGAGAATLQEVAGDNDVSFAIAIRSIQDGNGSAGDPGRFSKLEKKVLLVQAVSDPFSDKNAKYVESVQKKAKNLTMWSTGDDSPADLAVDSELLDRISGWASERAS